MNLRNAPFTLLMLLLSFSLSARTLPSSFDEAMGYVFKQDYAYARLWIAECSTCTSQDSLFYTLLVDNGAMVDYESYALDGADFIEAVEKAIPLFLEDSLPAFRYRYYVATLLGAVGLVRVKTGDIVAGSAISRQSVRMLRELVKEDATFKPAYLGIGLYSYYLASTFSWVPFVGGGREDGVILIMRSASTKRASSYTAQQSLFWVLLDEERYDDAEAVALRFLVAFPDNTLMLRGLVSLYMRTGVYDKAYELASLLQLQAVQRTPVNWADFFSAGRSRALSLRNLGEEQKAKELVDSLLQVDIPVQVTEIDWVRRHIKGILKMQKDMQ